jgi:hypothetical protein
MSLILQYEIIIIWLLITAAINRDNKRKIAENKLINPTTAAKRAMMSKQIFFSRAINGYVRGN